jgi:protocatechuate 3,4-dioxygenase beta subunit
VTSTDRSDRSSALPELGSMLDRRRALTLFAGAGLVALVGCGSDAKSTAAGSVVAAGSSTSTTSTTAAAAASTVLVDAIPQETAGPFPGDGSNGPNILTVSGVVRSDITRSIGTSSGVAKGVPLSIELTVLDAASDKPLSGAAVYLWHCDQEGRYSMYSSGVTGENYLRGVQATGADGKVVFASIFPGAYSGRWPHVHFEVYPSLAKATSASNKMATSQLALPQSACDLVYATDGYSASVRNMTQTTLARDNVFSDGSSHQLATVTGDVKTGMKAALVLGV